MYLVCIFFTMQLLSMVAELCKNPARRMCVCSGNMVRIFRVFRNIHVLFQYPCSQASHHSNIWQSQLDAKKKVRKMHVQKKICMETAACNGTRVHMHVQLLRFAFLCANPLSDAKRTGSTEIHCVTAKTGSVHSSAQSKHEDAKHNQTTLTKEAPRCKTRKIAALNSKYFCWDSDCKVWFSSEDKTQKQQSQSVACTRRLRKI